MLCVGYRYVMICFDCVPLVLGDTLLRGEKKRFVRMITSGLREDSTINPFKILSHMTEKVLVWQFKNSGSRVYDC